jgi:acyl carrier protein
MDRETLRLELLDLVEQAVGERPEHLSEDQNLRTEMDLDSIDLVSLVIEVQAKYVIDIPTPELNNIVTVGNLLDAIQARVAAQGEAKSKAA